MLMKFQPASEVIDDPVPALSALQSYVRRTTYQRGLRMAHYFLTCLEVARQRRELLALDERALKDIGISRIDALREANASFWDIPEQQKPRR